MTTDTFTISVFWSDDDEGYIATVAEMPGISAFGETREEVLVEVGVAIRGALAFIAGHKAMADIPHKEDMGAACLSKKLTTTIEWIIYDGTPESLPEFGKTVIVARGFCRLYRDVNGMLGWMKCGGIMSSEVREGDMWAYWTEAPKAEE